MKKLLFVIMLMLTTSLTYSQINTKNCIEIKHKGYTTMFDTVLKYPVLVHWMDTKNRVQCANKLKRVDKFTPDPKAARVTNLQKDYTGSGYDRGHMCPAADNSCDQDEMTECFYFSNMAPQPHSLNAGDWKSVEEYTRELSIQQDTVYVWCGSVGKAKMMNTVTVPAQCWKVVYVAYTKKWYAWIMNNSFDHPVGPDKWVVKVSDVEKLTGFKFKI